MLIQTVPWLVLGTACGFLFIALVRRWGHRDERRVLALGLVAASLLYVLFAATGYAPSWIAIELIGLMIFALIAELGVKHSVLWLAAGWAAHPLWDAGLHLYGMGANVAPPLYVLGCIGFDLIVAAYVIYMKQRLEAPPLRRA